MSQSSFSCRYTIPLHCHYIVTTLSLHHSCHSCHSYIATKLQGQNQTKSPAGQTTRTAHGSNVQGSAGLRFQRFQRYQLVSARRKKMGFYSCQIVFQRSFHGGVQRLKQRMIRMMYFVILCKVAGWTQDAEVLADKESGHMLQIKWVQMRTWNHCLYLSVVFSSFHLRWRVKGCQGLVSRVEFQQVNKLRGDMTSPALQQRFHAVPATYGRTHWQNKNTQHAQHAQRGSKSGELIYDATSDQDEEKQVRSHAISVCQDWSCRVPGLWSCMILLFLLLYVV